MTPLRCEDCKWERELSGIRICMHPVATGSDMGHKRQTFVMRRSRFAGLCGTDAKLWEART